MLHHRRLTIYSFVLLLTFLLACGLQNPSIVYGESDGQITGRVTNASGTPIGEAYVLLYTSTGSFLSFCSPDSIGNYTFVGLASGTYKVMFDQPGYAAVWYNGASSEAAATIVTVTAPNVTSGIDGVMGIGGQITGRVTDASGTPISDVFVYLYTSTGSPLSLNFTDSIGNYTFAGFTSGTYKVRFAKTGCAEVWYNGASSEAAATIVTVTAPNVTSGIDGVMGHPTCAYTLSPSTDVFASSSAIGSITVTPSSSSCFWTAASNDSWITITSGSSGTGSGTVTYSITTNTTESTRTGTITVAEQTFTVTQNGSNSCTYTTSPTSSLFSSSGNTGMVTVTTSSSSCSWSATSNALWITITAGSAGTGNGVVSYSVSANTTGTPRTGTMTVAGQTFTVLQTVAYIPPGSNVPLYFPHVDTNFPWQTEIAIINTGNQTVTGTLRGISDEGQIVETKDVTLPAHGRRQITIVDEFTNHIDIGYIIFVTDSDAVQGYTKFYMEGVYRAAIPAVKEVNTSDIYISHIASTADWWTGVSLVNTTSAPKQLTITFNNGHSVSYTLNANQHRAFDIAQEFFNNQPQPGIQSAVITNASGIIGLELFGNIGGSNHLDGVPLTNKTATDLYYPHIESTYPWWTGIVAYNPGTVTVNITINSYAVTGTFLGSQTAQILPGGKYVGLAADLELPANTAWLHVHADGPLSGFELFDYNEDQLAGYSVIDIGTKNGTFAKIEPNGSTGIALVNIENQPAAVTFTFRNDSGSIIATQNITLAAHEKQVGYVQDLFGDRIAGATNVGFTSDRTIVGFQLNADTDNTMLDALPALF